jgi:predicted anti-sigma-YlaC factor YlaD
MNVASCEQVRELLPELIAERVAPALRGGVERHLAGCAECRAEHAILALVAEARPVPPVGLEARVLAAQRVAPRVRPRWGSSGQLAMAATLAAAVIGGALLIDGGVLRQRTGAPAGDSGVAVLLPEMVDPLLQGSLLPELTEAELEALLAEMDS